MRLNSVFPSIFVGHGSPTVILEEDRYIKDLRNFAKKIPRPQAIISISAHWEREIPLLVNSSECPRQIYDFYGFPRELYEIQWRPCGDPLLAHNIVKRLDKIGISAMETTAWGLDHGTWIPLSVLFPEADIPTLQISLPAHSSPEMLLKIGEALRYYRNKDILVFGSGNIVHNFAEIRGLSNSLKHLPSADWAAQFDTWIEENLEDKGRMQNYRDLAPYADRAVPTAEHFNPLLTILGSSFPSDSAQTITDVFHFETIAMRSVAFTS